MTSRLWWLAVLVALFGAERLAHAMTQAAYPAAVASESGDDGGEEEDPEEP